MREFLDTSVLVAAFYPDHPHHVPSFGLLHGCNKVRSGCGLHSLAEVYAVLSRMPEPHRASPEQAVAYVTSLRERLTLVALSEADYEHALAAAMAAGLTGGAIHDALLGQCARKARAEALFTWNVRDFVRLAPEIAGRVRRPA